VEDLIGTTEFELNYPQLRFERSVDLFRRYTLSSKNLLDIGCGNGTVTKEIREVLSLDLVDGVDLLADSLNTPEWLQTVQLDVDREDLPYSDSSFEAIYCGEVLEHLYNPDYLLDEVYRVLTPGGLCIITTPNLASWPNRAMLLLGYQPYSTSVSFRHEQVGKFKLARTQGHRGHIRVFTAKALKELILLHGFETVKFEGWEIGDLSLYLGSGIKNRLVGLVDRCFSYFPSLASRLAIVVRKRS